MSNIINFPAVRRLKRLSGEVFEIEKHPLHEVWLRINLPKRPGGPERAYLDILKNFCRTDQAPGALRYMATFSAVDL